MSAIETVLSDYERVLDVVSAMVTGWDTSELRAGIADARLELAQESATDVLSVVDGLPDEPEPVTEVTGLPVELL